MLNFNKIQKLKIGYSGIVPDGYFGDTTKVEFAFDQNSGKIFAIHSKGYYTYMSQLAIDVKEAIFLIKNHPESTVKNLITS